jgi:hypothetical protein
VGSPLWIIGLTLDLVVDQILILGPHVLSLIRTHIGLTGPLKLAKSSIRGWIPQVPPRLLLLKPISIFYLFSLRCIFCTQRAISPNHVKGRRYVMEYSCLVLIGLYLPMSRGCQPEKSYLWLTICNLYKLRSRRWRLSLPCLGMHKSSQLFPHFVVRKC